LEDAAKTAAGKTAEAAKDAGRAAADAAKDAGKAAGEAAANGAGRAKDWVMEKHTSGEISAGTRKMLESAGDGISATVLKGKQLVPAGLELARVAFEAYDKDVDVEAIYQDIGDPAAQAELDAQINGMPRVETIDGLEVGFRDITNRDASKSTTESAYLVTWRQEDKLVGFIYRSKTEIDIEQLVAAMPTVLAKAKDVL
jgi:hypothetical protein